MKMGGEIDHEQKTCLLISSGMIFLRLLRKPKGIEWAFYLSSHSWGDCGPRRLVYEVDLKLPRSVLFSTS